jgi:hypothetical protein
MRLDSERIDWDVALAHVLEQIEDGGPFPVHVGRVVFDTAFVENQTRLRIGGARSAMCETQIFGSDLLQKDIGTQPIGAVVTGIDWLVDDVPAVDSAAIPADHVGDATKHRRTRRRTIGQFLEPFRGGPVPEQIVPAT